VTAGRPAGSHVGSHADEQPSEAPDLHEQPEERSPRLRTDLNRSGRPDMELRIRRLGVRVPPSALDIAVQDFYSYICTIDYSLFCSLFLTGHWRTGFGEHLTPFPGSGQWDVNCHLGREYDWPDSGSNARAAETPLWASSEDRHRMRHVSLTAKHPSLGPACTARSLFPPYCPHCHLPRRFRIAPSGAGMPDSNSVAGAGITALDGMVGKCDSRNIEKS
jgi:hypothetical protein